MIRTLALISVAGFVLATICLITAVSIAGPDILAQSAWGWNGWLSRHHNDINWTWNDDHELQASRDLTWDGGDALTLEMPANVHFTQADGPPKMTISGPREAIANIAVKDGHIRWNGGSFSSNHDIDVQLTAPKITQFTMESSGDLQIRNFHGDRLVVRNNGSGDVTAEGSAKTLELTLNGSGDANLGGLTTDAARVVVSGSSDATVTPKTSANLEVTGSGSVTLTTHPKQLESRVTGSGRVEHADGTSDERSDGDSDD
jgi:hypothetical protein